MREKHQLVASCPAWTRDQPHNLGMCPDWKLNPQSFGAQDDTPTNQASLARAVQRYLQKYSWQFFIFPNVNWTMQTIIIGKLGILVF